MPQAAQSPTTTVSTATASRPVGAATATSRSASPAGTPASGAPATPTRTQKHEATQHRQRPGRRRRSTGPGRQNRRAQQTEGHAEARAILVGLDSGRRGSEDGSSSCPLKPDSTAALTWKRTRVASPALCHLNAESSRQREKMSLDRPTCAQRRRAQRRRGRPQRAPGPVAKTAPGGVPQRQAPRSAKAARILVPAADGLSKAGPRGGEEGTGRLGSHHSFE